MSNAAVINLFGNNKEQLTAGSRAILEARGLIEAEMQASLSAQAQARVSAHARLLAQSRAHTEMELVAQLKAQRQKTKLVEVAQDNFKASKNAQRAAQQKLDMELLLQTETHAKLVAEQQAQAELNNRLEQEKKVRAAAEALSKIEREWARLLNQEWKAKLDQHSAAEKKLKLLQADVAKLMVSTERVSAEINAAEQMQISYAGKKQKLEMQLRNLVSFQERVDPGIARFCANPIEKNIETNIETTPLSIAQTETRLSAELGATESGNERDALKIEQDRVEAEHRLLNECWSNAGHNLATQKFTDKHVLNSSNA